MTHACIPDFSQPALVRARITGSDTPGRVPFERRYRNLPDEPQPGTIEPWQAVTPIRPDTALSRSLRFLDATGELLAAAAIIGGGMLLTGLASLL